MAFATSFTHFDSTLMLTENLTRHPKGLTFNATAMCGYYLGIEKSMGSLLPI